MAMPNARHPPGQDEIRLFLALMPGEAVQAELARCHDRWRWSGRASRYGPSDWHVTLHFIGSLAGERLDALRGGLAVPFTPFALRFGHAELWPHGLAVLCPDAVLQDLLDLHTRLGDALRRLGLATDTRPYRPHVTLARQAPDAVPPDGSTDFVWPVTGYALVASTGRSPQRYRVLQRFGCEG